VIPQIELTDPQIVAPANQRTLFERAIHTVSNEGYGADDNRSTTMTSWSNISRQNKCIPPVHSSEKSIAFPVRSLLLEADERKVKQKDLNSSQVFPPLKLARCFQCMITLGVVIQ